MEKSTVFKSIDIELAAYKHYEKRHFFLSSVLKEYVTTTKISHGVKFAGPSTYVNID